MYACTRCNELLPLSAGRCHGCGAPVPGETPSPAAQPGGGGRRYITRPCDLLDRPFAAAGRVGRLGLGEEVWLLELQWGFAHVETSGGRRGFVAVANVATTATATTHPPAHRQGMVRDVTGVLTPLPALRVALDCAPRLETMPSHGDRTMRTDTVPSRAGSAASPLTVVPASGELWVSAAGAPRTGVSFPEATTVQPVPSQPAGIVTAGGHPALWLLPNETIRFQTCFVPDAWTLPALVVTDQRVVVAGAQSRRPLPVVDLAAVEAARIEGPICPGDGVGTLVIVSTGSRGAIRLGGVVAADTTRDEILTACRERLRGSRSRLA